MVQVTVPVGALAADGPVTVAVKVKVLPKSGALLGALTAIVGVACVEVRVREPELVEE